MEDCLFCKIVAKQVPSHFVYENEAAFAFLDIHPSAPGHTMVVPKVHASNLLLLPAETLAPLFEAVREVVGRLERVLHPTGFTIGVNHGEGAGVEVDHLHVHIIPRFKGDEGKSVQSVVLNPQPESLEDIAKRIRSV